MKNISVLLLGRNGVVVEDARAHLQMQMPDVEVYAGTGLDDLRATLAPTKIDHVIIGGGREFHPALAALAGGAAAATANITCFIVMRAPGVDFRIQTPKGGRWRIVPMTAAQRCGQVLVIRVRRRSAPTASLRSRSMLEPSASRNFCREWGTIPRRSSTSRGAKE